MGDKEVRGGGARRNRQVGGWRREFRRGTPKRRSDMTEPKLINGSPRDATDGEEGM